MIRHTGLRATTYDVIGYLIPGTFDFAFAALLLEIKFPVFFNRALAFEKSFGWSRYLIVTAFIYTVGHLHSSAAKVLMKLIRRIPHVGPRIYPSWQRYLNGNNKEVFARVFKWRFGFEFDDGHSIDDKSLRQLKAHFDTTLNCPGFTLLRFQSFYSLAASLALFSIPVGLAAIWIANTAFPSGGCLTCLLILASWGATFLLCLYMFRYNITLYNAVLVCSLIEEFRTMDSDQTQNKASK